ncbi:MAG: adenylate kinase [Firmicutes bacterium]|nr:adenylate kinase [Bacillota bacterium]
MIYLIGGSSHVGKTLLAQKLMERCRIPYLSLDHIKMMFIRSHLTSLTVYDDYKMRYFLWPYVAELIKTAIENDQQMIIEGCYIPSEWREAFIDKTSQESPEGKDGAVNISFKINYLDHIRSCFIVMSEQYLRENIDAVGKYASVIEHRIDDETDLERLINCSREFEEECQEQQIPCLVIDEEYDVEKLTDRLAAILEMA